MLCENPPVDADGSRTLRYLPEPEDDSGGRPTKLTDELAARIAAEVRLGAKPVRAAALCGIGRRTWYDWLGRHEAKDSPYVERVGTILLAMEAFEAMQEQRIASAPEWQASAWILKTRHRKEYGDKVEVRSSDAADVKKLSRAELTAIALGKTPEPDSP